MEIIKLNLIPSGVNPTCHCSQYDNGRVIRIDLFDGLTPYVLQSGDTVTLNVRKPDNTIVTASLTATQGNTYVNLVTTEQMCACVGYNLCDLTITNGSVEIGTLNFIMQVERDVIADGIPSQSVIEDLDALVQEAVGDQYYTKSETDALLDDKADKSTTYTKTEVDSALANKANANDFNKVKTEIFNDSPNLFNSNATTTGLLNVYGEVATQYTDYFTTDFIPVEYNEDICVQDAQKVSSGTIYICEYDESKSFVGSRQSTTIGLNVTSGSFTIANSTAKYIRISFNTAWHSNTLMISEGDSAKPYYPYGALLVKDSFIQEIKTPVFASVNNGVLRVITKYTNTEDLCVKFEKKGGNNLPDFSSLSTIANSDFYPKSDYSDAVSFLDITTDWHSPYIVKALNNIDGDEPDVSHFTGGNHNYSNTGASGYTPTAICDTLKYYVDGVEVTEFNGYCKNVKIVWSNRVQASNTKKEDGSGRNVLRENHVLYFDGETWESSVEIIPLEDILISSFYGFQANSAPIYTNIRFIGAVNRGLYVTTNTNTSGDNKVNAIEAYGNTHKINIELDTTYDIGNRRYYSGTSGAFNSAVKLYFYLIASLNPASANNSYRARARYKFSHL